MAGQTWRSCSATAPATGLGTGSWGTVAGYAVRDLSRRVAGPAGVCHGSGPRSRGRELGGVHLMEDPGASTRKGCTTSLGAHGVRCAMAAATQPGAGTACYFLDGPGAAFRTVLCLRHVDGMALSGRPRRAGTPLRVGPRAAPGPAGRDRFTPCAVTTAVTAPST